MTCSEEGGGDNDGTDGGDDHVTNDDNVIWPASSWRAMLPVLIRPL